MTWGDIKKGDFMPLSCFGLDYQASSYLKFVPDYYTYGSSMMRVKTGTEELTGGNQQELDPVGSNFYHGCKGHWLLHDIQKNGLNQPITIVLQRGGREDKVEYATSAHRGRYFRSSHLDLGKHQRYLSKPFAFQKWSRDSTQRSLQQPP